MTDTRDEATGQFASGGDQLSGEAYGNHQLGFTTRPDDNPPELGPGDAKELAETFAEARGDAPEPDPAVDLSQFEDPDAPKEALTQTQLVNEVADRRFLSELSVERRGNEEVAAWADMLRAEMGTNLGTETEKPAQKTQADQPASVDAEPSVDGLAPDLEKALRHPQVREAVEAELGQASQAREHYAAGLEHTRVAALATLAEVVPHLEGLPPHQFEEGLALLSQVDPPAFQKAMNILGRVHAITQAQQQNQQQHAYAQAQEFRTFKTTEDAKLAESLGADRGLIQQYQPKVESYFKGLGLSQGEMQALANDRTVNSAAGQRVLLDAMRYQDIMQAKTAIASRAIPPVQRPGTSISSDERRASSLDSKTGKARDRINSGRGEAKDLGSLIGALRRG